MGDAIPNMSTARLSGFTSFPRGVRRILVQSNTSTIIVEPPSREFDSLASSCEATAEPSLPEEDIETIDLTQEENEISMKTPERNTDPADSPSSGFEAIAETINKTLLFVTLLTKSRVLDICTEEQLAAYAKQLVDQTLQGLTVSDSYCPNDKDIKQICRAVIKDLTKKLGGKRSLKFVILSGQPRVEVVIVKSLQANISKHSTVSANNKKTSAWREHFWPVMSVIAICGLWSIVAIILL